MGQQSWTPWLLFSPRSRWAHIQHRIVEACLTVVIVPPFTPMSEQGHLQKVAAIRARRLRLVHHILCYPSIPPRHANITQIIGGWEDNLASHLAGTWSWRWHLRLGGWCVRYPWHTSPAGIARSIPLFQGQLTPAIALHVAQYQTPFWSLQNNNKVVFFFPFYVI